MELQDLETDRCIALANTSGRRCQNKPQPGGPWCANHGPGWKVAGSGKERLRAGEGPAEEERGRAPQSSPSPERPDPGPEAPSSPDPVQREPRRDDFSEPRGVEDGPLPGQLERFDLHEGPEAEGAARGGDEGREIDPELFRNLEGIDRGGPGEELQEEREEELEPGPGEEPGPEAAAVPSEFSSPLLQRFPGPFNRREGERVQRVVMNGIFRRFGKEPLSRDELEYGAEPWAACLNYTLGRVDPNTPWGAMSLYLLVTAGPRFVPDAARAVGQRVGLVDRSPDRAREEPGEEAPGEELQEEEPEADGGGWAALELVD